MSGARWREVSPLSVRRNSSVANFGSASTATLIVTPFGLMTTATSSPIRTVRCAIVTTVGCTDVNSGELVQ